MSLVIFTIVVVVLLIYVSVRHMCVDACGDQKRVLGPSGDEVIGSCDPPDVDAGN